MWRSPPTAPGAATASSALVGGSSSSHSRTRAATATSSLSMMTCSSVRSRSWLRAFSRMSVQTSRMGPPNAMLDGLTPAALTSATASGCR